ncbi:TIGR01906 family membrane protein [Companilactobacillus pabuli]|jgi:integral membrane protein (TIGR01906 family)|uniref:TIGR01906 family membrane protein n=1 Tax=Companilactobacillus pabuli TaxID=2714036 RepID=A0A7L7KXE3_9LACO|nr:TIGR01906 family membrane protein [Companilactobacillus pabuli]AKP02287.1 rhodopsin [Companilactobacillus farciminis]AKS50583.1 rhodopsin [Companilactobacillus farciminis]MDG5113686.1 TIGR01906 family membrane protein [Companilactobacillus pabuli]QMT84460.1 TIGR01906 family membrane protein [Companilactobacillus pabuli]
MSNTQKDLFYTIALAFFILTAAITITIFASYLLFAFDIKHYYLEQAVSMKYSTIMKNYAQMMDYLINPFNWHFQLSDFTSSASGRLHFEDCKKLFLLNFGVFIGSGLIVAKFRKIRARFNKMFLWIGIVGIVVAILMLLNFDEFFVIFHEVLFRNSDWLFDPDKDPVINILPEEFFTQCFILFFILFEGLNFWKANKKAFRN